MAGEKSLRLNARQEQYCRERAKGKTYKQSYIDAGFSPTDAHRSAIKLERERKVSPLIQEKIEKLKMAADAKAILGRQERQALLTEIALAEDEKTDNRLRATDMLNRMAGDYTDVVRSTVTGEVNMTYEERKRLLEQELMDE